MSLVIIFGLLESIIVSAVVFCILLKKRLMVQGFNAKLKENLSSIDLVKQKADSLMSQLVPFEELKGNEEVNKIFPIYHIPGLTFPHLVTKPKILPPKMHSL